MRYGGQKAEEMWPQLGEGARRQEGKSAHQGAQGGTGWVPVCPIFLLCWLENGSGKVKMAFGQEKDKFPPFQDK